MIKFLAIINIICATIILSSCSGRMFTVHRIDVQQGNAIEPEKVEQLKQNGIQFDLDPTDQNWLWREARLKDVDGNQLVLFYGGENRQNPPWRIEP